MVDWRDPNGLQEVDEHGGPELQGGTGELYEPSRSGLAPPLRQKQSGRDGKAVK